MRTLRATLAAIGLVVSGYALAQAPGARPDEGWPAGERLMGKFRAGQYADVIAEAPAVIRAEPWNVDARLAYGRALLWSGREWESTEIFQGLLDTEVGQEARISLANSYAWSGRMSESLPHYRLLAGTPKADEAKLGQAHALRWMGRDDLALPLYDELRAKHPGTDIAEEGQFFSRRAVRARTLAGFLHARDNTPMRRNEPTLAHTFRAGGNTLIFGIEASGGEDRNAVRELDRREYTFRAESIDSTYLAPRLTVSRQTEPRERTFGELRLQVTEWPLYVHAGRVNWGKLAFNVNALDRGMTANQYGIAGTYQVALGEIRGSASRFSISDDNRVDGAEVRLATRWRPWGREIKPLVGVAWRRADRTDPDYWSPRKYALGFVGLEGEWVTRDYSVTALGHVGFKIAGEAATSWAASIIAKRWVARDWAVGLVAYAQRGTRESNYHAEGASLTLEKLW